MQNFANELEDTDAIELTPKTIFKDLAEFDSLATLSIMSMTQLKYGKILSGPEILECDTIENLYNLILSK